MEYGDLPTFGEVFPLDRLIEEREEVILVIDAVSFERHDERRRALKI
jgi:predicted AAA+ superfamily ATPase